MTKNTLLFIDTDTGFFNRFQRKLEEEDITERYQVHLLEPDTTLNPSEMAAKVVAKTNDIAAEKDVCAIFVDIVIYERAEFDTDGILIVKMLRKDFRQTPIFNVSAKSNGTKLTHMDHFAEATLGDSDGVFAKSFLEGETFSAKRLALILKRGAEKRQNDTALSASTAAQKQATTSIPTDIKESFDIHGLDCRVAAQIEELGPGVFWRLIQHLIPDARGVISYVTPGASGAYVFEAKVKFKNPDISATGAKQFLIKIATEGGSLENEAHNMRELVRAPVSREHFPNLLHNEPIIFGGLSGIAYEFETDHETLLAYLALKLRNGQQPEGLGLKLVDILKGIYGDPMLKVKQTWHGCYFLDESGRTKLRGYLMENRPTIEELVGSEKFTRVDNFLMNDGETLRQMSKEIDTRFIHGDFNCGNILINGIDGSDLKISIIDLGSRRQDHIIRDVAKLERDIVFRVFDWGSSDYHNPNRMSVWRQFLTTIALDELVDPVTKWVIEDQGVLAAAVLIAELRSAIKKVDTRWEDQTYLVALLHYSLLVVLHPRVSTAKKAFAVEYASSIIELLPH